MLRPHRLPRPVVVALTAALAAVGLTSAGAVTASATPCSDVDVSFARGTGETPGLGSVGRPFATALTSALSGYSVSTYAVDYAANQSQSSAGPGATDMSDHVSSVAAACPNTRFVIGGYSQGGTVTDIAVGIRAGSTSGTPIPANLASRVAAVVVFGNPLGARGQTIQSASAVYGPRSRDYCNASDGICGRQGSDPAGPAAGGHLSYGSNGSTTRGGQFAADLVRRGGAGGGTTPTPTPTPTAPASACVTSSTLAHVSAGRATNVFGSAYAVGSRDLLGVTSSRNVVSLRQTAANSWSRAATC